ncbi:MAG: hypothetical protein AAF532_04720 [Planctomycetota bacterium]
MSTVRFDGLAIDADLKVGHDGEELCVTSTADGTRLVLDVPSDRALASLAEGSGPLTGLLGHFVNGLSIPLLIRTAGRDGVEVVPGSNWIGRAAGVSAAVRVHDWGLALRLAKARLLGSAR